MPLATTMAQNLAIDAVLSVATVPFLDAMSNSAPKLQLFSHPAAWQKQWKTAPFEVPTLKGIGEPCFEVICIKNQSIVNQIHPSGNQTSSLCVPETHLLSLSSSQGSLSLSENRVYTSKSTGSCGKNHRFHSVSHDKAAQNGSIKSPDFAPLVEIRFSRSDTKWP